MTTVAIIGTCGRGCISSLYYQLYLKMFEKAKEIIKDEFKLDSDEILLISGGAAWADHIVVDLFLDDYAPAKLYLPCRFLNGKFENNSTGKIANYYHEQFSLKTNKNSLEELQKAIKKGIETEIYYGFKNRNTEIAKADYLIAFTFNEKEPKDGGTFDTWSKSKSNHKIHVDLNAL